MILRKSACVSVWLADPVEVVVNGGVLALIEVMGLLMVVLRYATEGDQLTCLSCESVTR
jgi:hypothetical protein